MAVEHSEAWRRRQKLRKAREERYWASKSGPVTVARPPAKQSESSAQEVPKNPLS